MIFTKFPSIENLKIAKETEDFQMAKTLDTRWVVNEKIDGTNISININKETIQLGKRNSLLGEGAEFYKLEQNFHFSMKEKFEKIQKDIDWDYFDQITVCGEYFGIKVLNRIYYGSGYYFRFFAVYSVDKEGKVYWFPFKEVERFLSEYGMLDYIVPRIGLFSSLEEALEVPNNRITSFADDKHKDEMEGVIIEPYDVSPVSSLGNFKIKNKNDKFVENSRTKICAYRSEEDTYKIRVLKSLKDEFRSFCTESRMYGIFSKMGTPSSPKETGKYLSEFIEDAKTDFFKEHKDVILDEKEIKFITNIGSDGYLIFKTVLNKLNV